MKTKKRRKLYMPSSFGIIFILMFVFILLSWILQAAGVTTLNTEKKSVNINGLGILDVLTSIWYGFVDKADIILFILSIGGLLNIMARTKAIDASIEALVKKLNGKEIFLIPALMLIFGLGGTTYGMWEETIAFFPVLIPVFIKAGYGAFTAVLTILVGAGVGTMASTVNPFAVGSAVGAITTDEPATTILVNGEKFTQAVMMGTRWLTWVIFMSIAIPFVMFVAVKTKKGKYSLAGINQQKIEEKFTKNEEKFEFTIKRKITIVLFMLGFLLMILAYLPWGDWLGDKIVATSVKNADKSIFWLARSSMWEGGWGGWYFISLAGVFLLVSIIVFAINNKDFVEKETNKENTFINVFIDGSKDVLAVCLLIATAAGLGKILEESNIGLWIANSASSLKGISLAGFAVIIFILSVILSFFIPSTSGFAAAFIPIFASIATKVFDGNQETAAVGLIMVSFILASGLVNLISPTSAALMAYTGYAEIPYPFWVKKVGPFVGILFVISLILITIFAAIASNGTLF